MKKILLFLLLLALPASAGTYFNSTEPGCDGSNPDYLWCDDFEDESWFVTNTYTDAVNDGWGAQVGHAEDPFPPPYNGTVCLGSGAAGTNCAATSGLITYDGRTQAEHAIPTGESEVFVRYYVRPSAGMTYGTQKFVSVNTHNSPGTGGINVGGLGSGEYIPFEMCPVYDCGGDNFVRSYPGGINSVYLKQNQGNNLNVLSITGHWIAVQFRIKLNTGGATPNRDGIWQLWLDDCGVSGRDCTGSPTLRSSFTDVIWMDNTDLIRTFFFENWAPVSIPSNGIEYYDQIIASKTGPIPFATLPVVSEEQRCTQLGAGCFCSERLDNTDVVQGSAHNPSDSVTKPCGILTSSNPGQAGEGTPVFPVPLPAGNTVTNVYKNFDDKYLGRLDAQIPDPLVLTNKTMCTRFYVNYAADHDSEGNLKINRAGSPTGTAYQSAWAIEQFQSREPNLTPAGQMGGQPYTDCNLDEETVFPNPVKFEHCQTHWCRIENCVEHNAATDVHNFRQWVTQVGGTREINRSGNCGAQPTPTSLLLGGVMSPVEYEMVDHPETAGTQYVSHAMVAIVPYDPDFWIGPAHEIEPSLAMETRTCP